MKNIFLYFLAFYSQILAQSDFKLDLDIIQSGKFFNSEIHYFPTQNEYIVFYSYKISNSQLFFEKENENFNAGINVSLEIRDTLSNSVKRVFDKRNISVKDFALTSSENDFLQGVVQFPLTYGNYKITAVISDITSKRERRIPPIDLKISDSNNILNPIVFDSDRLLCENEESYVLSNNSTSVPFNKPQNDLVIPVSDLNIESITFSVKQGDTIVISNNKITDSFIASPEIKLCDQNVVIRNIETGPKLKIFLLKDFSSKLSEGPLELEIVTDDSARNKSIFNLNVIWINKPLSLLNAELAIKILEIIETKEVVSELQNRSNNYYKTLYDYWGTKDPTPNTSFNELMNEFYNRIDYSEITFKTISGNGGAKSDRGKVYIKYGVPDSIDRSNNDDDKVVESWFYKKINRTFIFLDKEGIGKFQLVNEQ
jgi:GWxTD domain-containing protein